MMSVNDIEFVNPEFVFIKTEETKENDTFPECPLFATNADTKNTKCGEIFTSNNIDFLLICAYCGSNYSTITDFGDHIRDLHRSFDGNLFDEPFKSETDTNVGLVGEEENLNKQHASENKLQCSKSEKRGKIPKYVCENCNKTYCYRLSYERHKCQDLGNVKKCEAAGSPRPSADKTDALQIKTDISISDVNSSTGEVSVGTWASEKQNSVKLIKHTQNGPELKIHHKIRNPDLYCDICYRQFKYKNVFRKHGMQHIEAPTALRKDPTYLKCIYCGMSFDNNAEWLRHENQHPKSGLLRCSVCSKKFSTELELDVHTKSHGEQAPVKCEQCGMSFSQAKNLMSHINRVHLQLKPFACELCDRKFVRKVELSVHMRRHTGERPYQCEECGRSFMISTLLNEHLKRHSNVRDVQCPVCPMAFFTKKMLRKHMVKHSTERPYVCSTCGNNFSRKKALIAHKKIHMEVKQYVCNLCGKAFAQHAGLYMHKKTHMNAVESL